MYWHKANQIRPEASSSYYAYLKTIKLQKDIENENKSKKGKIRKNKLTNYQNELSDHYVNIARMGLTELKRHLRSSLRLVKVHQDLS